MKKDIHPEYNKEAKITCACGSVFSVGSTKKEMKIEICSKCHPFFTGEEKIIDAVGKIEKFKVRRQKAASKVRTKTEKRKAKSKIDKNSKLKN